MPLKAFAQTTKLLNLVIVSSRGISFKSLSVACCAHANYQSTRTGAVLLKIVRRGLNFRNHKKSHMISHVTRQLSSQLTLIKLIRIASERNFIYFYKTPTNIQQITLNAHFPWGYLNTQRHADHLC